MSFCFWSFVDQIKQKSSRRLIEFFSITSCFCFLILDNIPNQEFFPRCKTLSLFLNHYFITKTVFVNVLYTYFETDLTVWHVAFPSRLVCIFAVHEWRNLACWCNKTLCTWSVSVQPSFFRQMILWLFSARLSETFVCLISILHWVTGKTSLCTM